jgi:hypothetical protein
MNSRQLVILTQEYAPFPSREATHATGVVSTLRWLACDVVVIASAYSDDDLDAMGAEESDLGVIFVCYFAKGSSAGGSLRSHVGILSSLNETFFSQWESGQALFDLSLVTPACMWPNPSIAVGPDCSSTRQQHRNFPRPTRLSFERFRTSSLALRRNNPCCEAKRFPASCNRDSTRLQGEIGRSVQSQGPLFVSRFISGRDPL